MFKHRNHVGRFAAVDQSPDGGVNQTVFVAIEVTVQQYIAHAVPRTVVQEQAAQHAGLPFNGMRRDAQLRNLAVLEKVFYG